MRVGDLIRHRNRKSRDPQRTHGFRDTWCEQGIVIQLCQAGWNHLGPEPAVKYMNGMGDIILAPVRDIEVLNEGG